MIFSVWPAQAAPGWFLLSSMPHNKLIMKYILSLCLIFFLTNVTRAQDSLTLNAGDIEGVKITGKKYFTGSNLWGHIDGAADLFLEYGFRDLRYYEAEMNGVKLGIEIYRFENPYEALGIHSVKKSGCNTVDKDVNPMFCRTKYALTFPVSDYYVTIAGQHGTQNEQSLELRIADVLYSRPEDKGLKMKDIYPSVTGDFRFVDYKIIMGPVGFQNGLPDWSTRFGDYRGYVCIWYSVMREGKNIDVFLFNFKIKAQLESMLKENGWHLNDDEVTISGDTNWLISRKGDMLMILTGKVTTGELRELKEME